VSLYDYYWAYKIDVKWHIRDLNKIDERETSEKSLCDYPHFLLSKKMAQRRGFEPPRV
jgi:hypothetical protein